MILANTRGRLDAKDLRLVLLLLSRGSPVRQAGFERRLEAEGPDALLDEPALAAGLLEVRSLVLPSQALFFYVLIRDLLRRRRDRAFRVDWHDDQVHHYLVDIVADLAATEGERRFQVMAHLGNFALWLSGLFPDYIAARRLRKGGPDLSYYDALGRRGFALASDHALADRYQLDGVFRAAADHYDEVRRVLNQLSDRLLFPPGYAH